jgi:hypothetical protein
MVVVRSDLEKMSGFLQLNKAITIYKIIVNTIFFTLTDLSVAWSPQRLSEFSYLVV